jgi:hypothetical protein
VFELVPPEFNYWISHYYQQIGSPTVTQHNVWNIYEQLLQKFETNAPLPPTLCLDSFRDDRDEFVKEVQHALNDTVGMEVNDLRRLAYDEESGYMGGVHGGLGPDIEEGDMADGIVRFLSDEESKEESTEEIMED